MSAFGSEHLVWEVVDGAGWLTIDRAEKRNAMSLEMYGGIGRCIAAADTDESVGVVVITGVEDTFCIGGGMTADVLFEDESSWPGMGYVPDANGSPRDVDPDEEEIDIEREVLPFERITGATTTVISAVNGLCIGGGFIISLSSDVTIASDRAAFRVPELLRGVPDPWMPAMLPAFIGLERAKYLMLTAQTFDARRAHELGMVSEVVEHDSLRSRTEEIVDMVLRTAPVARGVYKAQANRYLPGLELDRVRSDASVDEKLEGFRSFAERRAPSWIPQGRRGGLGRQ